MEAWLTEWNAAVASDDAYEIPDISSTSFSPLVAVNFSNPKPVETTPMISVLFLFVLRSF